MEVIKKGMNMQQKMPHGKCKQDVTTKMDEQDKFWFIHSHWEEYENYTKRHGGKPFGFPFPDGSCVEKDDDDECFGN